MQGGWGQGDGKKLLRPQAPSHSGLGEGSGMRPTPVAACRRELITLSWEPPAHPLLAET